MTALSPICVVRGHISCWPRFRFMAAMNTHRLAVAARVLSFRRPCPCPRSHAQDARLRYRWALPSCVLHIISTERSGRSPMGKGGAIDVCHRPAHFQTYLIYSRVPSSCLPFSRSRFDDRERQSTSLRFAPVRLRAAALLVFAPRTAGTGAVALHLGGLHG